MRSRLLAAVVSLLLGACSASPDRRASGAASANGNAPAATASVVAPGAAPDGMVWIPGGEFSMGSESEHAAPAERPVHTVVVDGFFMDAHPVTNADFRAFVDATGYMTIAERPVSREEIMKQMPPGTPPPSPELLVPGSLVFAPTGHLVSLDDWSQWWSWTPGANWRHPIGPDSAIDGKDDLPVVQIAWDDAAAYAKWRGGRLPTEAEWERAARGGIEGAEYAWGNAPFDPSHPQARIYEGVFPTHAFAPVAVESFAPNGYGLFDMSGNVWEWTADWFRPDTYARDRARGAVNNPTGPDGPDTRAGAMAARVLRGGSFLCSDSYCRGYRVSARSSAAPDSGASHIGFRIVMSVDQWRTRTTAGDQR